MLPVHMLGIGQQCPVYSAAVGCLLRGPCYEQVQHKLRVEFIQSKVKYLGGRIRLFKEEEKNDYFSCYLVKFTNLVKLVSP